MGLLIKELNDNEKPRERLKNYGVNSLSNEELISIILRTGTKSLSVKDLSQNILKEIKDLKDITINRLLEIKGIGEVKAITLIASIELGKRLYSKEIIKDKIKLTNVNSVYNLFKDYFYNLKQEQFLVIYLDTKKQLIDYKVLFIGTIDQSTVHPREIFKNAYLLSASFIICIHNHPSGNANPSQLDIEATQQVSDTMSKLGISVLDHIVI